MRAFSRFFGRRWVRRLLVGSSTALALIAVLGFVVIPVAARHLTEKHLGELLGRRVSVARIKVNPFALSLTVEGFQIYEADGNTPFVGFGRLYVNAQLSSIYRRAPVVKEIRLEAPRVNVARLKATPDAWADTSSYNFSDILARLEAAAPASPPPPPPDPSEGPPRFSINNIQIVDGAVTFDDRPLGSKHTVSQLNLGVPFVSTLPVFVDTFVEPGLKVRIDDTPFAFGARSKPFKDSLDTTVELRADDFDLTRYLPYVPVRLRFDVASALLDVALDVSFVRSQKEAPTLTVQGRVALEKVALREKGGAPLIALQQLDVRIGRSNVTAQTFAVDKITIAGLDVRARRLADGTLNLEKLAPAPDAPPARKKPRADAPPPPTATKTPTKKASAGPGPRFTVGEIALQKAVVRLHDESVRPAMDLALDPLTVTVRGLSNAPGARATVSAAIRAAPGGAITHEGTITLEPLTAAGTVTVEGIEPGRFAPYYRNQVAFDIASGRVGLGSGYQFAQAGATPKVQLQGAFVEISDLALRKRGPKGIPGRAADEFFRLASLAIRDVNVDLTKQTVAVGQITTRDGRLRATRNRAGVVDLTTLGPPPAPTTATTTAAATATTTAPAPTPVATTAPAPAARATPAWTITLGRLNLDGWSARFEDQMVEPTAITTVSPIGLKASNFSTARGTRGTFDLQLGLNKQGRIGIAGSASLAPVAANLKLDIKTIELLPLQPYFADQVNLTVTDGTVSVKAETKVELPDAPARGPAPEPRVAFNGDIDIANFSSVDGAKHEKFLNWKSFHVGGLALSTVPMKVHVADIALTDFYSRLTIFPDAHLNVQDILAKPKEEASPPKAKPAPVAAVAKPAAKPADPGPPITIGQVTLQGGQVTFNDRLIRPNYTAELTELGGRLSGLSSDASTQADIDLRGSVDNSGALSILGKINPLANDLFVDVKVNLKDFELPPTSPYAGKYAGYGISKGKLGLSLDYHIANKKLDAKNRLTVDQFTFGDKVASPDATKLPVRLAVAILKDRHGVIDISVPISGSLDDPEFKIGRAVLKVIGNLIVKAVTAPFSLIASAFGGGDDVSSIVFAPGLAAVDGKAQGKIRALARALDERPGLSYEIEGRADPKRDRDDLRRYLFQKKLATQKLLQTVKAGDATAAADTLTIDPAERPALLEKAYKAETFPKPRNFLGLEKDLPSPEMEKLILANIAVDDDALRALAQKRANAVLGSLAKASPTGASRLFLVTPRLGAQSDGPANGVELRLKKD